MVQNCKQKLLYFFVNFQYHYYYCLIFTYSKVHVHDMHFLSIFSGNGNQTLRKRKSNFHQPSLVDGHTIRPKVDHVHDELQPLEFIVINYLSLPQGICPRVCPVLKTLFFHIDYSENLIKKYWSVILKNKQKQETTFKNTTTTTTTPLPPTMRIFS